MPDDKFPTKPKLAAQIKTEQAEAEALFLSIGEGSIMTDSHGRISRVNQAGLDILGFKRAELIGKWYPGIVIAENEQGEVLPNLERPITQVFITGEPISKRLFYRRKDGSRVAVYLNVAPILYRKKPVGAIEVFRDITQEAALERSKDEFISVASHQLRTPATAVKQYLGMLLEGYAGRLTIKQSDFLRRAYDSNDRQLRIIEDLLQVARVDAGNIRLHLREVDLLTLLEEVINEHQRKATERELITTIFSTAKRVPVKIDQDRMRMVFENLIDNAMKYSPKGKRIRINIRTEGRSAIVMVKDEGVGIDDADQPKLFQKFSRLPNPLSIEVGGTGLGLYWADRIVKLHKGRIAIESKLNKGSTFSVYLPLFVAKPTDKK